MGIQQEKDYDDDLSMTSNCIIKQQEKLNADPSHPATLNGLSQEQLLEPTQFAGSIECAVNIDKLNANMQIQIIDNSRTKRDKQHRNNHSSALTDMSCTNLTSPAVILKKPIEIPKASFLNTNGKADGGGLAAQANFKHLQLITGQKVF